MKEMYAVKKDTFLGVFYMQESAAAFAEAKGGDVLKVSAILPERRRFRSDGAYDGEIWNMEWLTAQGEGRSFWAVGGFGCAMTDTFLAAGKGAKLIAYKGWYYENSGYTSPVEDEENSPLITEILEYVDDNNIDIIKAWIWAVSALGVQTPEELLAKEKALCAVDGDPADLETCIERVHNREVRDIYALDCLNSSGLRYLSGLEVQYDRADKEERLRLLVVWSVLLGHEMIFVYQCYKMIKEGKVPRYRWGR